MEQTRDGTNAHRKEADNIRGLHRESKSRDEPNQGMDKCASKNADNIKGLHQEQGITDPTKCAKKN